MLNRITITSVERFLVDLLRIRILVVSLNRLFLVLFIRDMVRLRLVETSQLE